MLKRLILIIIATFFFACQFPISSANALDVSEVCRTVPLNENETIVLTNKEVQNGKKLFNSECAQCHYQGKTKPNPTISLSKELLEGAEPNRYSIAGLVDYMKYPTSYDGEEDYSLIHMNVTDSDLWAEMRNNNEEDLKDIAGYILSQINIDPKWGKLSLIDNNLGTTSNCK